MDHEGTSSVDWDGVETDARPAGPELERSQVGVRIVHSLLFALVISVMETLLFAVVFFQLAFSLITQRMPSDRVQRFANGIVAYYRQILRYLTHNDAEVPFPFSDFPEPLEPTHPAYVLPRIAEEPAPASE